MSEEGKLSRPVGPEDHVVGSASAPITLVEYGDFQCPYCGQAFPIVERVREQMGDRLRFVFRHFPLTEIHPHAEQAAEAAETAGRAGAFWPMHHLLFKNQRALEEADLARYGEEVGIPAAKLLESMRSHETIEHVKEDFLSGVYSGVNGTPTFFINGVRHDGAWDEKSLLEALQSLG